MRPAQRTLSHRGRAPWAAFVLIYLLPLSAAWGASLEPIAQDLLNGRADRATAALQPLLARDEANGPAHLLLCRVYLSELKAAPASGECRLALQHGLGSDAAALDWAGRAYGAQAQSAGPLSGLRLAGEVRSSFQAAVDADPKNAAAANDLGEYFVAAPGLVGGGTEKALDLAARIANTLPETAHRLRALVAEKQSDSGAAEREYQAAVRVAQSPGALVDLANFYVRQHDPAKAVQAAQHALQADRTVDANVVDAGVALTDAHQPEQAAAAFRAYLQRGRQSDQAPAFRVHVLLGNLLSAQGDRAGARAEYQEALRLASGYAPAQRALEASR